MAKVGDGTLVKWVDGQDVDAVDINRNFEVLRVANNDTSDTAANAAGTIDSRIATIKQDLDTKYAELVSSDEVLETSLTQSTANLITKIDTADAQLRTDFLAGDSALQTQVDNRPTITQTDEKISAAIATVVAGNAVIPTGATFPPVNGGRVDGEEFILIGQDGSRTLYFFNISKGMWESAVNSIRIPDATTSQKGLVQLTDVLTGSSTTLAPNQKIVAAHTSDTTIHITAAERVTWNNKQVDLTKVSSIELNGTNADGTQPAYIDFHTTAGSDFDGRIIMGTGNKRMEIQADQDVVIISQGQTFSLVDLKSSVSSGKAQVAAAITGKGQTTAADATFATMASNINNISTDPKVLTGNLNTGVVTAALNTSQVYTIPGLPKAPVAFSVTVANMSYTNGSNISTAYTISRNEFVVDMNSRSMGVPTNHPFDLLLTISGNQLTIRVQNTSGNGSNVKYSLGAFTAIY